MIERRRTAICVPGFATAARPWTEQVMPLLESRGWATYLAATARRYFVRVRLCDGNIAEAIAALTPPGAVGWGHSDGCNVLRKACWKGARFAQLVLINPALDSDAKFPLDVKVIHVWHSPSDLAVRVARWLPLHPWGDMGARGYTGPSREADGQIIINYNKQEHMPVSSKGHNDVFDPQIWPILGDEMQRRVEIYRAKLLLAGRMAA